MSPPVFSTGAFLIPFFLFLVLCAFPLYYLEVCLGQFSGSSPLFVWRLAPLLRGKSYLLYESGTISLPDNSPPVCFANPDNAQPSLPPGQFHSHFCHPRQFQTILLPPGQFSHRSFATRTILSPFFCHPDNSPSVCTLRIPCHYTVEIIFLLVYYGYLHVDLLTHCIAVCLDWFLWNFTTWSYVALLKRKF